jgi:KDO2-lipid IV(A) lauroyltransferase
MKRPQYYLMPLGALVLAFVPRRWAFALAAFLTHLLFPLMKMQRRVIAQNLRFMLGRELTPGEADAFAYRVLRNLAWAYVDVLQAPRLCRQRRLSQLVVHNGHREQLDRSLGQGQSVILVTAHVGNWDLAGIYVAYDGYPLVAVFERITRGMSEVFNRFRGTSGMELVGMDERERMVEVLRSGKVLVLLGDRDLKGNGKELAWFSGRRTFPRGAASFSLRHNVPIVIGHFVFDPDDPHHRYKVIVEAPLVFLPTGDLSQDIEDLTALVVKQLECVVGQYPDQWLVFQPNWLESEGRVNEAEEFKSSRVQELKS